MTDPIKAARDAYIHITVNGGGFEAGLSAALSAYRDAEIENMRAQLAAARQLACNNAEGAANAVRECAELRSQLADCRAVLRKMGHLPGCGANVCQHMLTGGLSGHCGRKDYQYPHGSASSYNHHTFQPGQCTCGYDRVMGEG